MLCEQELMRVAQKKRQKEKITYPDGEVTLFHVNGNILSAEIVYAEGDKSVKIRAGIRTLKITAEGDCRKGLGCLRRVKVQFLLDDPALETPWFVRYVEDYDGFRSVKEIVEEIFKYVKVNLDLSLQ
ncbi:MAG: hypothetical protein ASUL_09559 [Candidatus Aramenus sulfurataquae]|uniref:Uncharacterized protein n=1 Tax=Candidatus Aramenus sulfurataquae TaxID=1326980 RepID=W7KGW2_9CREN|nr:MAG: hypothetical protein ASUL_09559 [Candidatus Aramenus sulfurataquae]